MAMKRKLDLDVDDDVPLKQKQLKLVPFPNYEHDEDVAMSDAEPLYPEQHHLRLPSDASASSSVSVSPLSDSPLYPTYDLYPLPFFNPESGAVDTNSHSFSHYSTQPSHRQNSLGLMQPSANGFVHHGANCTQIPKLRVACPSGLGGKRTMWSHCEQCGAIQMVDCD